MFVFINFQFDFYRTWSSLCAYIFLFIKPKMSQHLWPNWDAPDYLDGCGQTPSHFYIPSDQNLVQYNLDFILKLKIVFNSNIFKKILVENREILSQLTLVSSLLYLIQKKDIITNTSIEYWINNWISFA